LFFDKQLEEGLMSFYSSKSQMTGYNLSDTRKPINFKDLLQALKLISRFRDLLKNNREFKFFVAMKI